MTTLNLPTMADWKPWYNRNNTMVHTCGHLTSECSGYSLHLMERLSNGLCYPCWRDYCKVNLVDVLVTPMNCSVAFAGLPSPPAVARIAPTAAG